MPFNFGPRRARKISPRRELPPALVAAGLAASYVSPATAWPMVLTFGAIVLLMALRKWAHAAAVLGLCSWTLIPIAAGTVFAVGKIRGRHDWFEYKGEWNVPWIPLKIPGDDPCVPIRDADVRVLPVGPKEPIDRGPLCATIVVFSERHNRLVIDSCRGASFWKGLTGPGPELGRAIADGIERNCSTNP